MSKKNKERLPHQTTAVGVKESVGDHIFNIINTILMIVRSVEEVRPVMERLNAMIRR